MTYQIWQALDEQYKLAPGRTVQALVPLLGRFDLRGGEIYRVFPPSRKRVATARPATRDELAEIDWAIAHGALQIELQPHWGLIGGQCGGGLAVQDEYPPRVLYRATGLPTTTR